MELDEYAGAPPLLLSAEQYDVGPPAAFGGIAAATGAPPLPYEIDADGADGAASAAAAAALSLEARFAGVIVALMRDEVDVAEALLALKEATVAHVAQLRDRSSSLLHRSAQYLTARALADELEGQAGTWSLLLHLYAMGESPAGLGGPPVRGGGGRATARQALRAAVNGDPALERVAHVVAWLESQAAVRLAAAPPRGFAAADGLWRETLLLGSASAGAGSAVTGAKCELDPDAPTRGAVTLRAEDRRSEERLAAQLWALLRAGKHREAQDLCRQCGQHWRAAALAGGGAWGPLPVGAAAADADDELPESAQAEDLSAEVEAGRAGSRALWRWACAAAADAAAAAAPGNRAEAAVFGALAGHVARVLPACSTWEDEAWAYCRAWLDLGAEEALAAADGEAGGGDLSAALDEAAGAGAPAPRVLAGELDPIPADVLASLLESAGATGYSTAVNNSLLRDGLSLSADGSGSGGNAAAAVSQAQRLRREGDCALVPASFADLRALLAASANAAVRAATGGRQRALQLQLMAENWYDLVLELAHAALDAHQQQQAAEAAAAASGAAAAGAALARRGGGAGFALLRFAAHVALALRALGLVRDPRLLELQATAYGLGPLDADDEREAARLQEALGRVVRAYADALAEHAPSRALAVPYLCHLRAPVRGALLARLVRAAAAERAPDADCAALHAQLSAAFDAWHARQAALEADISAGKVVGDADCGPTSLLCGDVRAGELRELLAGLVAGARRSAADGPAARVALLRWLFYPYIEAQRAALEARQAGLDSDGDGAGGGAAGTLLEWDDSWGDALAHASQLAAELALAPAPASLALHALFKEAVPEGFVEAVATAAREQLPGLAAAAVEARGGGGSEEALAAAEAEADLAVRLVERQAAALAYWREYANADAAYREWKAECGAALLSRGAGGHGSEGLARGAAPAAARGEALVEELLRLAASDALAPLAAPEDDAAGPDDPTRVRLVVVAAAGTAAAAAAARRGGQQHGGSGSGGIDAQGGFRSALEGSRQLVAALAPSLAALAATPDVDAEAAVPGEGADETDEAAAAATAAEARARGAAAVHLASFQSPLAPGAPDHERLRVHHKALRSWRAMAAKAAWLLGSRGGDGSGRDSGSAAPRLVPVAVEASFATLLQIARHRVAAKLLARAAKVALALTRLGRDAAPLRARLVALAAGADAPAGAPHLAELLAPGDARRLLALLAAGVEESPAGAGGVFG